jgi:Tfp pilus assembly protein PilO
MIIVLSIALVFCVLVIAYLVYVCNWLSDSNDDLNLTNQDLKFEIDKKDKEIADLKTYIERIERLYIRKK